MPAYIGKVEIWSGVTIAGWTNKRQTRKDRATQPMWKAEMSNYFPILLYGQGSLGRPIPHNFFALDIPISFSSPEVHFTCPTSLSLVMDKRGFFAGYELSGCWTECCLERMGEWEGAIGILWPLPPSLSIVHSHQDWSGHQTPSQSLTITCSINTAMPNKQLN